VAYARGWGLDAIARRVTAVAAGLRGRLSEVPGVVVHDRGERRSGIVTFTKEGLGADDIRRALARQAINVSVSLPSSTPLDAGRRGLPPLVRASVHYLTTDDELDRTAVAVAAL
jgi:selenocysteine lyase/cysteine desulfurase